MSDKSLDRKTQEFGKKDFGEGEEVREQQEEEFREEEKLGADGEFGKGEEVREGEESCAVENDGETISVSSSNKRMKEMPIDRLSALPECLIIHILSFLEVKKAAVTSLLSKGWRFLWTELPRLNFRESSRETEKIREFVAGVHRTIDIRSGNYLEKFGVGFEYAEGFASDVDVWVEFAVKNKAKEVSLTLNSDEDFYTLPQMMYSNSSLTRLFVRGCILAPERMIEWRSLTSLNIQLVELPQHVIEKILSGCPILHRLDLEQCWGFNRLEVNSRSLSVLDVSDFEEGDSEPLLEISAPYIRCLDISLYPNERKLRLTNIPSLVRVNIDFTGYDWDPSSAEVMSSAREVFEDIQHIKDLEVGRQCFEVLSQLVANGWQLPQSRRVCLTVNAVSYLEHNISGMVALLESSPNLEGLIVDGFETRGDSFTWGLPAKDDLDCDLLHLKTVKIRNFAEPYLAGDPMLTLARILLKRATVLEGMTIITDIEDTSVFVKMGRTLLTYPRSSQKAVILLP